MSGSRPRESADQMPAGTPTTIETTGTALQPLVDVERADLREHARQHRDEQKVHDLAAHLAQAVNERLAREALQGLADAHCAPRLW